MTLKTVDGYCAIVAGASRSGKTVYAVSLIEAAKFALIWDPEQQYSCDARASTKRQLIDAVKASEGKPCKIAMTATGRENFEYFCDLAYHVGVGVSQLGEQLTVVCEETSDVTHAGKAPEKFGLITRRGLKRGINLIVIAQSFAESTKTAVRQATIVHCCSLSWEDDIQYMSKMLGVPAEQLKALPRDTEKGKYGYIQRHIGKQQVIEGLLTFPGGKPKFSDLIPI